MFYEVTLKSHIRVPPHLFGDDTGDSILKRLREQFNNMVSKDFGIVIAIPDIVHVGEGVIIPGDGAAYYDTTFKVLAFKPELQEVVLGTITDITDFGAFMDIGPADGMIHISQTMDDFVNFSKTNVLTGKESKRTLKVKDSCKARIIAISYKNVNEPKIGLTMRQPRFGKLEDIEKEVKDAKGEDKKKWLQLMLMGLGP